MWPVVLYILLFLSPQHASDRGRGAAKFHHYIIGTWPVSPLHYASSSLCSRQVQPAPSLLKAVWNKSFSREGSVPDLFCQDEGAGLFWTLKIKIKHAVESSY